MTNNTSILIFTTIVLAVILAFAPATNKASLTSPSTEWKLSKNSNNVKVFTRQPEGSKIKEFKAVITVTSSLQSLENLIENASAYPKWQSNIASAKIVKQISKTEQYIYYTTDVPWPITDRDAVVYSEKVKSADGTITYNLMSKPDYVEEKKDFIRIKNAKGMWQFAPQGNKVEVTYQFYGDPAGTIPDWLINLFIVDGPYTTMLNLKKIVEKKTSN
jgi:hypothetical protein